ncbi:hypothetical protein M501DRAFT_998518 [Patellaria atrata CBS 101060]|uniref:Small ribosomal subunit protein uS5m n=1 Tax=Patellaria atrata CBS 101060 TaxID=1346257 RepID=A0A9P4SG25_9PEZI|nr:hypothetical protein M501DRAFT_998518 [Patellaria atrata CBS 101060]
MSISRPAARCLFSASSVPKSTTTIPIRSFHCSSPKQKRRRPHYPSIKASELGLIDEQASKFKPYTEADKNLLPHKYSPEQLAAIEAGETSIDPRDLATQAAFRDDPWRLNYLDDFSRHHPLVDKPLREDLPPGFDPKKLRIAKPTEMANNISNSLLDAEPGMRDQILSVGSEMLKLDQDNSLSRERREAQESRLMSQVGGWEKWDAIYQSTVHSTSNYFVADDPVSEAVRKKLDGPAFSALAPTIPKIDDPSVKYSSDSDDTDPRLIRLAQQTGLSLDEIRKVRVKILVDHFVVNQTRMGKIRSAYILAVAGNGNGLLGIGESKSVEPNEASMGARMAAIRNMKAIPRYEQRTIYGDVEGKVGAVELKLCQRPPGFGLRCQHLIFEIARVAGIYDLSAKVMRSRNKMNVVKATFEALMRQKNPEDIARARGRKMVDVRKVYYAGQVL